MLAVVAESDLIRMRTREGMAVAKAKGPAMRAATQAVPALALLGAHLVELYRGGDRSPRELAELFGIGRSTVYRASKRHCRRRASGQVSRWASLAMPFESLSWIGVFRTVVVPLVFLSCARPSPTTPF